MTRDAEACARTRAGEGCGKPHARPLSAASLVAHRLGAAPLVAPPRWARRCIEISRVWGEGGGDLAVHGDLDHEEGGRDDELHPRGGARQLPVRITPYRGDGEGDGGE